MLSKTVVLISFLQLVCVLGLPRKAEDEWKNDKVKALYDNVMGPLSEYPVTIIGWHYVHDANGQVKEVRTIDIVLEKIEKKSTENKILLQIDNGDVMETFPHVVAKMNEARGNSKFDFLASAQSWNPDGTLDEMVLIDKSDIWINGEDGDAYAMRNMTMDSLEDVKEFALKHNSASLIVLNPDGSFNEKESAAIPELAGYITGQTGATQDMLEDALRAVSDGYLKHRDHIIKHVAEQMSKHHPEYEWVVVSGHDGSYTTRDVHIGVEYELTDIYGNSVAVDMFGIKK